MAQATLDQIQQLVDQLSPLEQVKLLEYLTPRLVNAIAQQQSAQPILDAEYDNAWTELFRIGETIAAGDLASLPTLTSTLTSMRR